MQAPIDLTNAPDVDSDTPPEDSHDVTGKDTNSPDTAIDVLFEHQRGSWFCGFPLYSSSALLNLDPAAWCNAQGKASAVNVTNAQTPDPSWQWVWPTWYVDMSRDVDEEGWQYSFMFRRNTSWHGTHPWFHSFVRRRRWVRMRRKGGRRQAHEPPSEGRKATERAHDAHLLNSDYFTIHPTKTAERASTYAPSMHRTVSNNPVNLRSAEDEDEEPEEIDNLQTLLRLLRSARIDREKIKMVLRFLDEGGEDVYYLSEQMPHILSLFMFQYTRRQLLSKMLKKIQESSEHRTAHEKKDEPENEQEKQKIDNLLRAVKAAEDEVKSLEYWSDIKHVAQKGETISATDGGSGWDERWQGLDQSGATQGTEPQTDEHGHIQGSEARTAGSET